MSHLGESHVMKHVVLPRGKLLHCQQGINQLMNGPSPTQRRKFRASCWRRATQGDEEVIPLHGRPSNHIRSVRKPAKKCWFNRSSTTNVGMLKVDLVQDFIALNQEALSTRYTNCFVAVKIFCAMNSPCSSLHPCHESWLVAVSGAYACCYSTTVTCAAVCV